ncbi:MAG: DUF2147 domain-containing protein, partial [Alphaproteobacteria bacterium]
RGLTPFSFLETPMMRIIIGALTALLVGAGAAATEAPSPIGRWLTKNGKSHVEIYQCGAQLCGRIVWLRDPHLRDGRTAIDLNNPDPAKRGRPILGLEFLSNFTQSSAPGVWEGGRIYNPEDGEVYRGTITAAPGGKLLLRGYVGIPLLGKSEEWHRVK